MKRGWIGTGFLVLSASFLGTARLAAQTAKPGSPQIPNPLVEQLKSPDENLRAKAAREIGKSGDASAVPALAAALSDSNVKVRREVVLALAQIRQPASLNALMGAARDSDTGVRVLVVQALVGYYTGQAPSAGFSGFVKKEYRRAKTHFAPDDTRIDPGVSVDPKVVTALVETMYDAPYIEAAREAAKGLGILVAQSVVPELVKSAHSSDEDLAREALNALSKIKDRSAGPGLIDLLDSPNKDVKRDAAATVGILRANEALPKLQTIFENDADRKDKEKAIEGLAYLGDPVSLPLFTKALWSEDKAIRTSAAEGLARAADPKALPELEKAVAAQKDAGTRLAAEYALTALGKEDYLASLVHELASKFHGDVARSYLIELSRGPKFLPKLYPYLNDQDATVRRKLCTVLMYTGDQTSLEPLERLSRDPNGDVASEALRATRAIRARLPASRTTH